MVNALDGMFALNGNCRMHGLVLSGGKTENALMYGFACYRCFQFMFLGGGYRVCLAEVGCRNVNAGTRITKCFGSIS